MIVLTFKSQGLKVTEVPDAYLSLGLINYAILQMQEPITQHKSTTRKYLKPTQEDICLR